jgi:serine/threonine protein kinase
LASGGPDAEVIVHHDHDGNEDGECHDMKCVLQKKLKNFESVIEKIGGELEYVKSGTTGHTFKGCAENLGFNYGVKIVAFPKKEKYGDPNDSNRPENAELLMLKVLSQFVINGNTPHIVLPIGTFNTDLSTIMAITKDMIVGSDRYDEFVSRYNNNEFYSQASILLSEWADCGDFLDYVRNNYRKMKLIDWKVFFFQILSVLAVIQYKYPAWRHNDLKANNILVQNVDYGGPKVTTHAIAGKTYIVPGIGRIAKIWDFDFACLPGIVPNSKVETKWTKAINVRPVQHRYYDMHYFFNTLGSKAFFPKLYTSNSIPEEVREFVRRVVPKRYRDDPKYVTEKGRIKTNEEVTTPQQVIEEDPFFKEFRYTDQEFKEWKREQIRLSRERRRLASEASNVGDVIEL